MGCDSYCSSLFKKLSGKLISCRLNRRVKQTFLSAPRVEALRCRTWRQTPGGMSMNDKLPSPASSFAENVTSPTVSEPEPISTYGFKQSTVNSEDFQFYFCNVSDEQVRLEQSSSPFKSSTHTQDSVCQNSFVKNSERRFYKDQPKHVSYRLTLKSLLQDILNFHGFGDHVCLRGKLLDY